MIEEKPVSFAGRAVRAALDLYGIEVSIEQADLVARGAVAAMREPSSVMLQAGAEAGNWHDTVGWPKDDGSDLDEARKVWSAMIVAGMNEPVEQGG